MAFCKLAGLRPQRARPPGEKRANVFERYTEKARRVIFFARYEASQYGSPYIETEHLLLGLMREDKALANRFLRQQGSIESIRKEIEARITIRERISTSVEVPLSAECKRILNMAGEEAERLGVKHVGTEHLLLGILREEKCFGAEILMERGLRLSTLREELARTSGEKTTAARPKETSLLAEFSRDLTQAASEGSLDPLVGREGEVERVIQILCRRTKNNPVLIGEPGVGKTAIVEGLAQRISDGDVPPFLADKRILSLPLSHRRRHQIPRPVRRAPQDHHERIDGEPERHRLHRRAAHTRRCRFRGRFSRRRQYSQASALPRRDSVHRRHHARRISQIRRERSLPRAALPIRKSSRAQRRRSHPGDQRRARTLRKIPRRQLHRRRVKVLGLSFKPLHSRPLPSGQGHRSNRRSRRPR